VIITGDITDHNEDSEYIEFLMLLQRFKIPTFVCVGNHDVYSGLLRKRIREKYEEYIGYLNYSFSFGKYHFIVIDDVLNGDGVIGEEQLKWIESELKLHNGSISFLAAHVPMFKPQEFASQILEPSRSKLLNLIKIYKVKGFFSGHHHRDYVVEYNCCKFITTTTVAAELGSGQKYRGYRLIHIVKDEIVSYESIPIEAAYVQENPLVLILFSTVNFKSNFPKIL